MMTLSNILDRLSDITNVALRMPNSEKLVEDLDNLWADIDNARFDGGVSNW